MTSRLASVAKTLIIVLVVFSLASFPGPLLKGLGFPALSLASANPAPTPCNVGPSPGPASECWIPAGPAIDTLQIPIFTDSTAEFTCFTAPTPCVDVTDAPLPPPIISSLLSSPNYFVTSPVSVHSFYDIQFMLANNYWGCNFNFGNNNTGTFPDCGAQIRQGISHLVDKVSFTNNQPSIAGHSQPIDNPLPLNNGGLPTPNACSWDKGFPETGTGCVVGASSGTNPATPFTGGTAYHLAAAAFNNGFAFNQPGLGSADFCAAAQHFINAGLATRRDPTTCVLAGISSTVTTHTIGFFVPVSDTALLQLGQSIAQEICALFGQGFIAPCQPYLSTTMADIGQFPGLITSATTVSLSWHMYVARHDQVYPFDSTLFFTYNSRFVSGIPSIKPGGGAGLSCSPASVPSFSAANYMYLCNPGYDSVSALMEFAPCLNAAGDPTPGSASNGPGGNCANTSQLSAISAGVQTEDAYGKNAFSIPIYAITIAQFGYLSNWRGVINGDGSGIPNFFTSLDAYSPNPAVVGTLRQGFSQNTRSLNPYFAESAQDFYVVRSVYDSLGVQNPLASGQLIQWMTISEVPLTNSSLTYVPPPGTTTTFRFTLRSDMFFQDGRRVGSFDVAFTYLSMMANGVFQSSSLSSITGLTLFGPTQFDINMGNVGPFTLAHATSPTILPGRYWSSAGSGGWDASLASCMTMGAQCFPAQYKLGPASSGGTPSIVCNSAYSCTFPATNLNADPAKISPAFDPLASGILIGSGPWQCVSSNGVLGTGCSSSGTENPPAGSYTLARFGKGFGPGSTVGGAYFRSNGNLALYVWSGDNGDFVHDFNNLEMVLRCYGLPAQPIGSVSGCGRWQQGIGANGGPIIVSLVQISIVARFVAVNWVAPFNWQTNPPIGVVPFPSGSPPILYEDGLVLNPASVVGCTQAYPVGGYDC